MIGVLKNYEKKPHLYDYPFISRNDKSNICIYGENRLCKTIFSFYISMNSNCSFNVDVIISILGLAELKISD